MLSICSLDFFLFVYNLPPSHSAAESNGHWLALHLICSVFENDAQNYGRILFLSDFMAKFSFPPLRAHAVSLHLFCATDHKYLTQTILIFSLFASLDTEIML